MTDEEKLQLHQRRESYFRSLQVDPNFQEFIQQGVFDSMADDLERQVKNSKTTGQELELARNKWLWALELKTLITDQIRIYDSAAKAAAGE